MSSLNLSIISEQTLRRNFLFHHSCSRSTAGNFTKHFGCQKIFFSQFWCCILQIDRRLVQYIMRSESVLSQRWLLCQVTMRPETLNIRSTEQQEAGTADVSPAIFAKSRNQPCVRNGWRETGTTGCVGIDRLIYGCDELQASLSLHEKFSFI